MFVRQRLSSEPDRYRGRRRVATPPRSRYAAVGAAAFVGAGVVAMGAGTSLPDAKAVNPTVLQDLEIARVTNPDIAARNDSAERANRAADRGADQAEITDEQAQADMWLLPLDDFTFTSPFGVRGGKLHAGIDLAAPEGMPYKAVHAGQVTSAGYNGGYGYAITIKQDDGTEVIYAHSRRLLVKKGDLVQAGQVIGEVGNTGFSWGTHLHIETHVEGQPTDPVRLLRTHGVDVKLKIESPYGNLAAS
jgi:murein DD-endopeptidase MepM/ murein hydrolase activator NlpD